MRTQLHKSGAAPIPSQFFTIFKSSSGYILVHILPTSSSKSATRLQREANSWLNKSATPGATLPVKTRISRFRKWKLTCEFTSWCDIIPNLTFIFGCLMVYPRPMATFSPISRSELLLLSRAASRTPPGKRCRSSRKAIWECLENKRWTIVYT